MLLMHSVYLVAIRKGMHAMPKENTHLWFAHGLLEHCCGRAMLRDISNHLSRYLLGAVIPDTFYYSTGGSLVRISETIHGRDGNPTNTLILRILDGSRGPADIAFILGLITHCALDITFHPVIYYLSGNYYDDDRKKRSSAVRLHRHLETCMDRDLNHTLLLHRIIRTSHLKGLVFEEVIAHDFQTTAGAIRHALRRQIMFNICFKSRTAYDLAKLSVSLGMIKDPAYLGLFYADVSREECIPEPLSVADLFDGQRRMTTLPELFEQARSLAGSMMEAAHAYWLGNLDRDRLLKAIPGLSLDTGRLGVSVTDIRYTKSNTGQG